MVSNFQTIGLRRKFVEQDDCWTVADSNYTGFATVQRFQPVKVWKILDEQ